MLTPTPHIVENLSFAVSASKTKELIHDSPKGRKGKHLGRIRIQTLVLLIPYMVVVNQTETLPQLSSFKDLQYQNKDAIFMKKKIHI